MFFRRFPEFKSFAEPGDRFVEQEDAYKRQAVRAARSLLEPFVSGVRELGGDDQAQKLAADLFKLTNLPGWRDKDYLDTLLAEEGGWVALMQAIFRCLKASDGNWRPPFAELLDWLKKKECRASITKLVPTYFLFLWDPKHHLFIEPRTVDSFLKRLGELPTGNGEPLTVEDYSRVLDVFSRVGEAIKDLGPRDFVDLQSFAWVVEDESSRPAPLQKSPSATEKAPSGEAAAEPATFVRPALPLNLILAGPPGTGKTYRLLHEYAGMFTEVTESQSRDQFVFESCRELRWEQVCVVALALVDRPARVPELTESEVVQAKARALSRSRHINNQLWSSLQTFTPSACRNVFYAQRREPGLFWKHDDGRWTLTDEAREAFPDLIHLAEQIREYKPRGAEVLRFELVSFHPSYSYEDFVEGVKPTLSEGQAENTTSVSYEVVPGIFQRLVNRALADPSNPYALFIDEVNRGNVASIFGELITLIEEDKRLEYDAKIEAWRGPARVKLPYTHTSNPSAPLFGIPDNLYIIGTMNTADRSIALMDIALRRRFLFHEIMPDPGLLASTPGPIHLQDGRSIKLDLMLQAINKRIEFLYDRDHAIGHSYLMGVRSLEELEDVFRNQILPLLQEYFYDDWEKIQLVLGDLTSGNDTDGGPGAHPQAIVTHDVLLPERELRVADGRYESRRVYEISPQFSAESFLKIYE